MIVFLDNVLTVDQADLIRQAMADPALLRDGRETAGGAARQVKANRQLARGPRAELLTDQIRDALKAHRQFQAAAWPKRFVRLLLSVYGPGDAYGPHIDEAIMGGVRTDLSFTLFLCAPDSYSGGELVLMGNDGKQAIKLDVGQAVLYPASSLHQVAPVTEGNRYAAVGWVRSLIRRPDCREILFDLSQSIDAVFSTSGKTAEFDRLTKVRANLVRLWAED